MARTATGRMLPARRLLARRQGADDADLSGLARLRLDVGQQRLELVAHERLLLEERAGEAVERRSVLLQELERAVERLVGQARLLDVAESLRLLRQRVVVRAQRAR